MRWGNLGDRCHSEIIERRTSLWGPMQGEILYYQRIKYGGIGAVFCGPYMPLGMLACG